MVETNNISVNKPEERVLVAYIQGVATSKEKSEVEEWLQADDAHEKEFMQIAGIYFARYRYNRILARNTEQTYEHVLQKIRGQRRRLWLGRIAVAAACITGVVVLSTIFSYRERKDAEIQPQIITIESSVGMRTHFSLPDGTLVALNSGSRLNFPAPFAPGKRQVTLNGEAFFRVAPDSGCPFEVNVHNKEMLIEVLGTEFNIEAYEIDDIIHTTLVKGSVQITLSDGNGVILMPSEKATYDRTQKKLHIRTIDTKSDTAWMDGKIIFRDTPLPEVLRKLSHFYDVEFNVQDSIIRSYRFTGTFDNRPLSQVLDYLKISSGIDHQFTYPVEDDSRRTNRRTVFLSKEKSTIKTTQVVSDNY